MKNSCKSNEKINQAKKPNTNTSIINKRREERKYSIVFKFGKDSKLSSDSFLNLGKK